MKLLFLALSILSALAVPLPRVAPEAAGVSSGAILKVVDAQLEFFKDANGAVTHLMLRQGPQNIKGSRQP